MLPKLPGGGAREMVGHVCKTASALDCRADWREQQDLSNDCRSHASIGGGFVAFENGEGVRFVGDRVAPNWSGEFGNSSGGTFARVFIFGAWRIPTAFLAAADAFLVSAFVNMVSEACFTGKPVYVLPLEGGGGSKFDGSTTDADAGHTRTFVGELETGTRWLDQQGVPRVRYCSSRWRRTTQVK